jgi:hypothetical protein
MSVTASAQAQSDVVVVSPSEIQMMPATTAEARLAELELAYQDVKIRGPRAGVPVSAAVIFGGAMTAVAGAVTNACILSNETNCRNRAGNTMVGIGVAAIGAGITGLIVSSVRLKRAKEKRRRFTWEMQQLQGALP